MAPSDHAPGKTQPEPAPAAEFAFADAVAAVLAGGFYLNETVLSFIDDALESPESLVPALTDPDLWDAGPVAALVFSPDPAMLVSLEDPIDRAALDAAAVERVIDRIASRGPRTRLTFCDGRPAVALPVPPAGVEHFVRGLQPARGLAPQIKEKILERVPQPLQAPLRSRLRRMRLPDTEAGRGWLFEMLETVSPTDPRLIELVTGFAEFLTRWPETESLYGWLMRRKHRLLSTVTRALRCDDALCRHNGETLMLRGELPPHLDTAAARREIGVIDAIGFYLFGRTEMTTTSRSEIRIDPDAPEPALERTLHLLS